jgi:hypothetical protein
MTRISEWLRSWLFRRAPLSRSVVADRQIFDGTYWRLALPLDWTWKPASGAALYFESGDGAKGVYLTALYLSSQVNSDASATAKSLHEPSRQRLEALKDYQWSMLADDITASESGAVGILDAYDRSKGYRICTKVVVALPYAVRAAFHDYGCDDVGRSRAYSDSVFQSLEVGRAQAGPGL